ncbi:MAG: hypothetical protein GC161_11245 [Planctomycetaceae bacterium]|nr:hypothetical protein [Planctomycetaceae bacterium]
MKLLTLVPLSLALLGSLALASAARFGPAAQGPVLPPNPLGQDATSPEEELRRLFAQVERSLRQIDDMLFEAGAGDPLVDDADSGLAKLLEKTLVESRLTVERMDRILDVAQQMSSQQQSQSSSGQGGQSGSEGSESGGQQRGQAPRQGQEGGEENPDPSRDLGNSQNPGERPEGQGENQGQPNDGQEGGGTDQQQGSPGAPGSAERAAPGTGANPWGDLPPRVQQIFRTQGGEDMPPAYRGWIDAYHRRLGQSPR